MDTQAITDYGTMAVTNESSMSPVSKMRSLDQVEAALMIQTQSTKEEYDRHFSYGNSPSRFPGIRDEDEDKDITVHDELKATQMREAKLEEELETATMLLIDDLAATELLRVQLTAAQDPALT